MDGDLSSDGMELILSMNQATKDYMIKFPSHEDLRALYELYPPMINENHQEYFKRTACHKIITDGEAMYFYRYYFVSKEQYYWDGDWFARSE